MQPMNLKTIEKKKHKNVHGSAGWQVCMLIHLQTQAQTRTCKSMSNIIMYSDNAIIYAKYFVEINLLPVGMGVAMHTHTGHSIGETW